MADSHLIPEKYRYCWLLDKGELAALLLWATRYIRHIGSADQTFTLQSMDRSHEKLFFFLEENGQLSCKCVFDTVCVCLQAELEKREETKKQEEKKAKLRKKEELKKEQEEAAKVWLLPAFI